MKIDVNEVRQRLEEYLEKSSKIYPIEIARILNIKILQAERLYRRYREITNDNQLPSINARNFFNLYFDGKLSLKPPKNALSPLKMR